MAGPNHSHRGVGVITPQEPDVQMEEAASAPMAEMPVDEIEDEKWAEILRYCKFKIAWTVPNAFSHPRS